MCQGCFSLSRLPPPLSLRIPSWRTGSKRPPGSPIVRDDWGIAHVTVRPTPTRSSAWSTPGRGRLQSRRDQLPQRHGPPGRGRRRVEDLPGPAHEALHRPRGLKTDYAASPAWLRKLMDAFADGLNFYLYKHPEVKPRVIRRFRAVDGAELHRRQHRRRYRNRGPGPARRVLRQSFGGAARARSDLLVRTAPPSRFNTAAHHALLLINPHTSFYFRSELQMSSDEAWTPTAPVTWGQFFVYQGFNDRAGWMHTSSGVDAVTSI